MSCGHGWHGGHGCGPWHGWGYENGPYDRGGPYARADWYEDVEPPRRRRQGRGRDAAGEDLEARLSELRDQVQRLEEELSNLRAPGSE